MIGESPTAEGNTLLRAAQWIEAIAQGPLVTSLAVVAIAAVGFAMLNGRLPVRRGLTVALGCFMLFGAPAIARGMISGAGNLAADDRHLAAPAIEQPPRQIHVPKPTPPAVSDPYAGASIIR